MKVTDSSGTLHYEWIEDWAKTPDTPETRANGRTHGVAEAKDGNVYVFHQSTPAVAVYDQSGRFLRSFADKFSGAHGLTLVEENGVEYLWLTNEAGGPVGKLTLAGEAVQWIDKPSFPPYPEANYMPTWVAVNPNGGDIWVTDGYGASLVHRYDKNGKYLATIDGTDGAGHFACPHAVWFDTRGGRDPELYIADRANRRVQVYDGEGTFKRSFGEDFLIHPCAFASFGDVLYVPELYGRLAVLNGNDQLIGYVGEDKEISGGKPPEGYPNFPRERVVPGKFVAPHGVGTGADGSVYVVEWYYPGGRITRLVPS
ncbi:MAG TPA: hypothetical protein VFW40_13935 [Capsulimonadaceae bacterium]|nr:hypothetical protein [Capsulimonadaceae bacterium]